ncbi:hypothetical protein [Tessaracoccus sp.]
MDTNASSFSIFEQQLTAVRAAGKTLADFETLILKRFEFLTRTQAVKGENGRKVDPIVDITQRDEGGYGRWHLPFGWWRHLDAVELTTGSATIEHTTDGDHGSSAITKTVRVRWADLAADVDPDYEQYLLLKARFEPGT